ncbi:MAG: single-stranded-DNA-specific exonuclease RecJ [Ruminococcus sp.]|nr:single-stranded-DNA-specific exonuclease RecJ [Ruminococcus sp.]
MKEKWFVAMKKADFERIAKRHHISPILARLLRNRDVIGAEAIEEYLNGNITDLWDGMLMKDMDRAVEILAEKIRAGAAIRVIGDYDIDGVNATYILQEGLSRLGAEVDTDIPDRVREGFGLNRLLIDRALKDGIDTMITCDNGIAACKEIAYGKERGMTVIVTDHHAVQFLEMDGEREYQLPPADAVVDPHQPDCPYPFKELCGAAVAYKLIEALYEVMGREPDEADDLMENVAIATVGDVVDLRGENRIFVKQGLEMLKQTKNEGLKALMVCTKISVEHLNPDHIAYILGPCINASGRLDTAKRALELLNANSWREAVMLAEDLKALNDSRKEMTEKGVKQAIEVIENTGLLENDVLVVYLPDCHESVAGIIAGRIREKYYRPTFILTPAQGGVKGSGRSIESYDLHRELCRCSSLFLNFGGHKMAAGLLLKEENVGRFRETINALSPLTEKDLEEKVSIDMRLPFSHITEALISELELLEPTGKGNAKPLFAEKNLRVIAPQIIGRRQNALKFQAEDERGNRMDAIYFGDVQECMDYIREKETIAVTYYPSVNEYKGTRSLQIRVLHYQ